MSPVKMLIFVKKREDMTRDLFIDYWRNNHGAVFMEFSIVQKHILKYEIFLDDAAERAEAEGIFGLAQTGYDGAAILTFDSMEGARAVYSEPEFAAWAQADEPAFCKTPGVTLRVVLLAKSEIIFERK